MESRKLQTSDLDKTEKKEKKSNKVQEERKFQAAILVKNIDQANNSCCARFFGPVGEWIAKSYYNADEEKLEKLEKEIKEYDEKHKSFSDKAKDVYNSCKQGFTDLFSRNKKSDKSGEYKRLEEYHPIPAPKGRSGK
jgi:hypothetical protein